VLIPNPFKDVHSLRSEKRKAGKDLVTFHSAEGQKISDLQSNTALKSEPQKQPATSTKQARTIVVKLCISL